MKSALVVVLAASLPACVPYPIYKTLRPTAKATVLDQTNRPIPGAEVTLISSSYPYGFVKDRVVQKTGSDGVARFSGGREWRVEAVMIHGAEVFFWNWCVRKDGNITYSTSHRSAELFDRDLLVWLRPGASRPCPKFL
jgi:hypothetical protein